MCGSELAEDSLLVFGDRDPCSLAPSGGEGSGEGVGRVPPFMLLWTERKPEETIPR
jgi:hypothetical protein